MTSRYSCCAPVAVAILLIAVGTSLLAAPLRNHPVTLSQPDGSLLNVFVSGDEYFNWIHDKDGYTIIQDPNSGYYTYAILSAGAPVPTQYIVGRSDPASMGLQRYALPMPERMPEFMAALPHGSGSSSEEIINAPKKGTIKNLVVLIRFSGESEFGRQVGPYDTMFNSGSAGANSMYNYFREASYNQLSINTSFYPTANGGYLVSYQDSHARGYFQPYSTSNTIGYTGGNDGSERTSREHTLLVNAVNAISTMVPADLAIDGDNDGKVDNLCFIVKGAPTGWSSLLWPHQWSLYTQTVYIRGKQVYTYNFQLETSLDTSGVGVLCHEMFHSIGAPDLYHYSNDGKQPVFKWDLMEYDLNPPQHMTAYMKYRYGTWISAIPTISTNGTYTLNPLTSSTNNSYRINSPNSSTEYFVVEFRKKTTIFEQSLPGEGILVYRINSTVTTGNRNGPPDEVYIYRPNGTLSANGTPASANYSADAGRTSIGDSTNPSSFLSSGSAGGLKISYISSVGGTMSFQLGSGGGGTCSLTKPTLVSPSGSASATPTYTWNAVNGAEQYLLWVDDSSATGKIQTWYTASQVSCSSGTGSCSIAPSTSLASGAAKFYVRAWASCNGGTYGDWSNAMNFTVGGGGSASATVLQLWGVSGATVGGTSALWAQIKNTGSSALPSNAVIWFWVSGLSNNWVGYASVAGLSPGVSNWYSYNWSIPGNITAGNYTYYSQVFAGSTAISDWSSGQSFTIGGGGGSPSAKVLQLYPVSGATVGSAAALWAQVQNTGSSALPSNAVVWFWVDGLSNGWVGSASVSGLSAGGSNWYSYNWTIPSSVSPGNHNYYAKVFVDTTAISDWSSGQAFTIGSGTTTAATITQLWTVTGATAGGSAKLSAEVKNIGGSALPADARVWFYVEGGNISNSWVGYTSVAGLAVNNPTWCYYTWSIPSNLTPGTYQYYARVYAGSTSISDWSGAQSFTISGGGTGSGFNEQFDGSSAPNWSQDSGTWAVSSGSYHANGGDLNPDWFGTSTYKAEYSDCDYTALLYRTEAAGNYYWGNSGLIIRASGGFISGDPLNAYEFYYHRGGKFSVWKNVAGKYYQLQGWTVSSYINQGDAWNKLRVVAKGSSFWYYINDHLVWNGTDSSLSSGRAGFFFDTETGSADDHLWVDYAVLSTNVNPVQESLTEGQKFALDLINAKNGDPTNPGGIPVSLKPEAIAPLPRKQ